MAKPTRNKVQRERDLAEVARRYIEGQRQWQIAEALGVSQVQISYDLKVLQERWRTSAAADIEAHKARELARIDHLEEVYWQRWAESLKEKTISNTSRSVRAGGAPVTDTKGNPVPLPTQETASVRREQRDGNPSWLAGVQWCIERRCKLLGLDEPLKIDLGAKAREIAREYGIDEAAAVEEAERIVKELAAASKGY